MFDPNADEHSSSGQLPSPGAHILRVKEAKYSISSSGNPMCECTFEVVGADPESGRTLGWQYYIFTSKAGWKAAALCRAINPKVQPFDVDQAGIDRNIKGGLLVGVIEHYEDTWDGVTRTKGRIGDHRALTADERKKVGGSAGSGVPEGKKADDDIPF